MLELLLPLSLWKKEVQPERSDWCHLFMAKKAGRGQNKKLRKCCFCKRNPEERLERCLDTPLIEESKSWEGKNTDEGRLL